VAAVYARHHPFDYSDGISLAGVWLFTGLWLCGRLRAVLHSSPTGVHQEMQARAPWPRFAKIIFNGGLVLAVASLLLLFP